MDPSTRQHLVIPALVATACLATVVMSQVVADRFVDRTSIDLAVLPFALPLLTPFVFVPVFLAVIAAKPGLLRHLVVVASVAVAATAGALTVTTDDAQAGLAILLVSYVCLPLAALAGLLRLVGPARRRLRRN